MEKNSEHPLAQAVVQKAKEEKIELSDVQNFQAIPGHGVSADLGNKKILMGTRKLMADNHIDIQSVEKQMEERENQGKTVMILAQNEEPMAMGW